MIIKGRTFLVVLFTLYLLFNNVLHKIDYNIRILNITQGS